MRNWLLHARHGFFNVLYRAAVIARDVRGLTAPTRRAVYLTDINIEPSNLCNADCVFCGYQFQTRAHGDMAVDDGLKIIDAAKRSGVQRLGLTPVVGEPLVHRGLEQFIRAAKMLPNPLTVGLTTNAILLTPARYISLVAAGIDSIDVSMTYPDEVEYARIYRNKGLKKVVNNLASILQIFERNRCRVGLSIRTPRDNWDRHPLFIAAREKGWTVSRNRFFDDWSGRTGAIMAQEGLLMRPDRAKRLPCTMLFSGPHFFSDGRATACGCRDLDGKSQLALDGREVIEDLRKVYETGAVAGLRDRFREGDPPDICRSCRHYNPAFAGEPLGLRLSQLFSDITAC
jgi:hypothetical protein